jgi:hypothetical protein
MYDLKTTLNVHPWISPVCPPTPPQYLTKVGVVEIFGHFGEVDMTLECTLDTPSQCLSEVDVV